MKRLFLPRQGMTTQSRWNTQYNPVFRFFSKIAYSAFYWLDYAFTGREKLRAGMFDFTHHELWLERLDPAFDGYRIVHLTDLHVDSWFSVERFERLVPRINAEAPDAIVITGDFVSYRQPDIISALRRPLFKLQARDGIFAVFGNHDYLFAYDDLAFMLRTSNVTHLGARFHTIRRGEAMLHIAGLDDMPNKPAFLDRMVRSMPAAGAAILLVHKPDFADIAAATGRFSLSLSGHTHGGQIVLPGIGPLFRPYGGKKYPMGLYRVGYLYQYTSRGLGTADVPLRINCPPEVAVFTLRASQS
jgi:hypothetical protein